ncbi:MAG: hypothetical protein PHC89_01140 [Candidatus Pacebacteria bacterium]|nr:hypothetical protein [Candidatus Paceibacterota bacterium]
MDAIIQSLQLWIGNYGFLGVFSAGIVEELIALIPSTLVQGFAGMILFAGVPFEPGSFLSFLWVVGVASALGVLVGSLPYVYLARLLGMTFVERYGKYLGVRKRDVEYLFGYGEGNPYRDFLFVFLRAVPFVPSVAFALYAGMSKMSYLRYAVLTLLGVFLGAVLMGLVGWFMGSQLLGISNFFDILEKIVLFAILGFLIYWFGKKKLKKRKRKGNILS